MKAKFLDIDQYVQDKTFSQFLGIETREFGNKENKAKKNEWKLRQRIRENNLIDVENQRLSRYGR